MTKRNYLKSVSVGVIALGTLAIGFTAVLPLSAVRATDANAVTQTVNLKVENVVKLRVTSFNGKKLGKDNQGVFSWTQDNNAGETKNQRNKLTVTADVDADYEMKIDGKSVKQGKITAGKDSEIEFDLPGELGVGKHAIEFITKGKDKQGNDVNATTKITVNWTAVIPSVIPDYHDYSHEYDNDNDGNGDDNDYGHNNGNSHNGNQNQNQNQNGQGTQNNGNNQNGQNNGNGQNGQNNGNNGNGQNGENGENGENGQGRRNHANGRNHQGKGYGKNHRRHGRRGLRSPNTGYFMINGQAYSKSTIALVVALIAAGAIAITTRKVYARHLLSKKQK